ICQWIAGVDWAVRHARLPELVAHRRPSISPLLASLDRTLISALVRIQLGGVCRAMGAVTGRLGLGAAPTRATLAINPWILAVAAINAILAVGIGALIAPIVWSVDGDRNLAAARALM